MAQVGALMPWQPKGFGFGHFSHSPPMSPKSLLSLLSPSFYKSLKAVRLEAPDLKVELSHSLAFLQGAEPGAFVVPKSKTKQGVGTHNAPLTEGLTFHL